MIKCQCFRLSSSNSHNYYLLTVLPFRKSIAPGEELRETVQMKPRRLGRKEIIANFQCKQLSDVTGVVEIDVVDDSRT